MLSKLLACPELTSNHGETPRTCQIAPISQVFHLDPCLCFPALCQQRHVLVSLPSALLASASALTGIFSTHSTSMAALSIKIVIARAPPPGLRGQVDFRARQPCIPILPWIHPLWALISLSENWPDWWMGWPRGDPADWLNPAVPSKDVGVLRALLCSLLLLKPWFSAQEQSLIFRFQVLRGCTTMH